MCMNVAKHFHLQPTALFPKRRKAVGMKLDVAARQASRIEIVIASEPSHKIDSLLPMPTQQKCPAFTNARAPASKLSVQAPP